jgi:hypothetical protein
MVTPRLVFCLPHPADGGEGAFTPGDTMHRGMVCALAAAAAVCAGLVPTCVGAASLWRMAIATVRAGFGSHYQATTSWQDVDQRLNIRGLGFFDGLHGQAGVATNGIEPHPVIRIRFR